MSRTLLIVDDIRTNREILKRILGMEYGIIEASNGEEAMAALNGGHNFVSAVLLDLLMPVMDGFEVLERMGASETLSKIPVIVMTGQTGSDFEEKALKLGAKDYIAKPYKPAIIKQRIRNTINLRETAATVNAMRRDALTGLYSREAFFDVAQSMVMSRDPGYYIMACFDIVKFKVINDQYGTAKGDEVLRYIADTFSSGFEPLGGICCRASADHFAVLYPSSFRDSLSIARIRANAGDVAGLAAPVTFCIGRYVVNDLTISPSAMFDRAMLAADSIKGRYDVQIAYYDESMRDNLIREQEIVTEMRPALDSRQFETWYQPQYNHSTGALIGAEALVRWRHPRKGLISPAEFVPVFEQNGFIYALDRFVWEEVCRYIRGELDHDRSPVPISVNISRYDVFRPDIIEVITGLLEKYRVPVELLRLEVTESAFAESTKQIISVVKRLIDLGFMIEIDDFGSGYSSLNTLKDVPAQIIKLDMRFLESSSDSQRGGNIVQSVVRMAKWLGMAVIAEGVETIQQADYLRSVGCNYIQGYLYGKPAPEADYRRLCAEARKEEKLLTLETVENLDNNAFWDPNSMDTLIFNSFVGGACIFEYHAGNIELLRATQKYAQVIGSAGMTVEDALELNWANHLDDYYGKKVISDIETSVATRKEITDEYIFLDLPGCPHETYLRTTMRVIAAAGERYLVYCTNENITAQRQAEKKERRVAAQLQTIMKSVNSGISAITLDESGKGHVIFANDSYFSILGYTREEARDEMSSIGMAAHPDDLPTLKTEMENLLVDRKPRELEYRCVKRDGSVIYVRGSKSIANVEGFGDDVIISVITDITRIVTAEIRAEKISEQMQAIMSGVDVGIVASVTRNGRVEFLFSNDKYYEIMGYTREQFAEEVDDPYEIFTPEDREKARAGAVNAVAKGESAVWDYDIIRRDGQKRRLRDAFSTGSFAGVDMPVQMSIFRDITEENDSEKRLRDTDDQLRFLNDTAHELLAHPDSELGIGEALRKLLDYFDGNRAYIFEFNTVTQTASNTYEVCAAGVSSEKHNLLSVPMDMMSVWIRAFERESFIDIESVDALGGDRAEERAVLAAQGIKSLVAVPLTRGGELIGFMGIDDPKGRSRVDRIAALGDYISVMLTRRDMNEKIKSDNRNLTSLMNDMPGGFVRMRVCPDGAIKPVYINDGFLKLTGMTIGEAMEIYASDALAGVHPEDVPVVREAISRMLESGEARCPRYRLRNGRGDYVWIMFFGRATKDESGGVYLNVYYTGATEREKEEERQRELLDNLPCGAALYSYARGKLSAVHLNKRYWELVNRAPVEYAKTSFLTAVHPGDRANIYRELASAIAEKRDISCVIRVLYGAGDYRPFSVLGRIVPKGDGEYSIYASYIAI